MSAFVLKHLHPLIGLVGMLLSATILTTQGLQIGIAMVVSAVLIIAMFIGARWPLWKSVCQTWPNIRFDRQLSWGMGQVVCITAMFLVAPLSGIPLLTIVDSFLPSWFLIYACCKWGCQKYGCCRARRGFQAPTLTIFEITVSVFLFAVTAMNVLVGFNSPEVMQISIALYVGLRAYSIYSREMPMIVFKRY